MTNGDISFASIGSGGREWPVEWWNRINRSITGGGKCMAALWKECVTSYILNI